MMGNDGEDVELEVLRQAALKSLQRNREKNAIAKTCHSRRSAIGNRNLIEIQTTEEDEYDASLMEEIVVAEGPDVDDSGCDEVIEEVIMSEDEEGSGEINSPAPSSLSDQPPTEERIPKDAGDDDGGSSSDEDALSVASRYSLYEDDLLGENDPVQTQPVRVRIPGQPLAKMDDKRDGSQQGTGNNQRRRSRSRSRDRLRSRSPVNRKRRLRDNSPLRRRGGGAGRRSRDREFRRRSLSREREFSRLENRDKSQRNVRKSDRTSPTLLPRKEPPGRRRTRSRSSSRERRNADVSSRGKKVDKSPKKSPTPELKSVPGVEQSVLEKRRQKFQGKQAVKIGEEKKIKLHSKPRDEVKGSTRDSAKADHRKAKVQTEPASMPLDSEDSLGGRSESPTNIKVKVEQEDQDHEDLRTKLIKKKIRAQQQGQHVGSGRIFSEALKSTRLGSPTSKSQSSISKSKDSEKVSVERGRGKQVQKRKVSLTYS